MKPFDLWNHDNFLEFLVEFLFSFKRFVGPVIIEYKIFDNGWQHSFKINSSVSVIFFVFT